MWSLGSLLIGSVTQMLSCSMNSRAHRTLDKIFRTIDARETNPFLQVSHVLSMSELLAEQRRADVIRPEQIMLVDL